MIHSMKPNLRQAERYQLSQPTFVRCTYVLIRPRSRMPRPIISIITRDRQTGLTYYLVMDPLHYVRRLLGCLLIDMFDAHTDCRGASKYPGMLL